MDERLRLLAYVTLLALPALPLPVPGEGEVRTAFSNSGHSFSYSVSRAGALRELDKNGLLLETYINFWRKTDDITMIKAMWNNTPLSLRECKEAHERLIAEGR